VTKGISKQKPETGRVQPESAAHALPPRRMRHKRGQLSYKAVLSSGLAVFGTLFFTLVGVELYQARQTVPVTAPLGGNETAQAERSADGQVSDSAASDGTAAPPTRPAGSTAAGNGEGQLAAPRSQNASSGQLPDGSSSTGARAHAGAAAKKPAAGAAPRPNVPPQNPATGGKMKPIPATGKTSSAAAPVSSQPATASGTTQAATPKPKVKRHVVQKGDTLFKLSRLYYGNNGGVTRIAGYNGLSPEAQLKAGDVLTIPLSP
jgi:nucleoid-associated protein YgaU